MWLLSGRGALRFCMLVVFFSGIAGSSDASSAATVPSDHATLQSPADAPEVDFDGIHFGGVNEPVSDAFRPDTREFPGISFTDTLENNDQMYRTSTGAPRRATPPAAIPLPAPVYLGLTGFAFMVSVKFVKRFFF